MNNVQKWTPVLRKCKEFSKDQYAVIAAALENQYNHFVKDDNSLNGIADFTRFALPITRRVLARLLSEGYEVNVVSPEEGEEMQLFQVGSLTPTEIEVASKQLLGIDREANLCDLIADQAMTFIETNFPEKKIDLFLVLVLSPNAGFCPSGTRNLYGKLRKAQ